jgi:hypothetical protein
VLARFRNGGAVRRDRWKIEAPSRQGVDPARGGRRRTILAGHPVHLDFQDVDDPIELDEVLIV